MGVVTFKRCKDILCHDQYVHVLCTYVKACSPRTVKLKKKCREFCGRDNL